MSTYQIGIPIIDQVDLLDVANAVEVFRWKNSFWKEQKSAAPLIGKTTGTAWIALATFNNG